MREVAPVSTKVAVPVAQDTVDDGAEVELGTKGVEHGAAVDARDGERGLVCLKAWARSGACIDKFTTG